MPIPCIDQLYNATVSMWIKLSVTSLADFHSNWLFSMFFPINTNNTVKLTRHTHFAPLHASLIFGVPNKSNEWFGLMWSWSVWWFWLGFDFGCEKEWKTRILALVLHGCPDSINFIHPCKNSAGVTPKKYGECKNSCTDVQNFWKFSMKIWHFCFPCKGSARIFSGGQCMCKIMRLWSNFAYQIDPICVLLCIHDVELLCCVAIV